MSKFLNIAKVLVVVSCGIFITSCEEEESRLGTNLFDPLILDNEAFEVTSYNVKLDAVETNDLPINLIGYYKDPVEYGEDEDQMIETTYSVMSQMTLQNVNPTFGTDPVLDSVVLTLPYFSSLTSDAGVNEEDRVYELDSVFGNSPIKLSIYKSEYYLADLDVESDFEDELSFFSDIDEVTDFNGNARGELLATLENYTPSSDQVVLFTREIDTSSTAEPNTFIVSDTTFNSPRLRISLPADVFQQAIIDKENQVELSSNSNFRNFFRGIYFEAEAISDEGSLIAFNFANANAGIELFYRSINTNVDEETGESSIDEIQNTFRLNFRDNANAANSVNIIDNSDEITLSLADQDDEDGAEYLYLKGGQGNMAVVELDASTIQEISENNWLINEANLEFYIREEAVDNIQDDVPQRIFIYDLVNETVLADFFLEQENTSFPELSRTKHLVPLDITNGEGRYTIKITEYIKALVDNLEEGEEIENLVLGITVSQNVNLSTRSQVKVAMDDENKVPSIPTTSVVSHQGVVLYGSNFDDDEKKLQLRIFYTDPN